MPDPNDHDIYRHINNGQWAIGNRQLTIGNRQWAAIIK